MQYLFLKEVVEDHSHHFRDIYGQKDDSFVVLSGEQDVFDALEERYSKKAVKEVREIATDVKEQNTNDTKRSPSDIFQDFRDKNPSNDYMASICHLKYTECSSRLGETSKSQKTFSRKNLSLKSAKNWFEKKIRKVFKKKEIHYQKLIEDNG